MRGRIPEEVLGELRDRASIVEVVSAHVGLRKVGRNHVGLCPFHAEKTPSFTVSEDRGIFHCFGCGVGGNVFNFLMRMENLAFPEVIERLAARYGVVLPERREEGPAESQREALFRLNDKTARFFQRYLWDAAEAEAGRAYLAERGIGQSVAERFVLGFAPGGGDTLARKLQAAGVPLETAERLGLVGARSGGGGHYDRFRARLMFPITDSAGRVVGFGSRSIPGTASESRTLPKYLNSPETPLYRKGAHLYGLAMARDAIRSTGRALVVEGYFDVLALVEAGIGHAVASLGTALTVEQLRLLRRFTRDVVVFFDGDAAGEKAAEKSLPVFLEAGLWGHGAFLPPGDDPDTFVRREGREAALALVGRPTALLDFHLDRAVRPASTVAERAAVAQRIAELLGKIADPFERDMTVRRAAERLGLSEELLRAQAPRVPRPRADPAPAAAVAAGAPDAEELLVTLMLLDDAVVRRVDEVEGLALFASEAWRDVASAIMEQVRRGAAIDAAALLSRLDDRSAARVAGRLIDGVGDKVPAVVQADGCLATLRRRHNAHRRRAILDEQIRPGDAAEDGEALQRALREHYSLRQGDSQASQRSSPDAPIETDRAETDVPDTSSATIEHGDGT